MMKKEGNEKFRVHIAEDNEWYNKLLVHITELNPDLIVESYSTGADLLASLNKKPDIVTIDFRLPDIAGNKLLTQVLNKDPEIAVVVISEQDQIDVAVQLLHAGATDYLTKSEDIKIRLHHTINRILKTKGLQNEVISLRKEVAKKYDFDASIVGTSAVMKNAYNLLEKTTSNDLTVNVYGETGTGKEVVSKAIHYNSNRKEGEFIAINVSAIPVDLIESELFGHERGSFTGADSQRKGKFELANKGTLFLDEIAEMNLTTQVKLLRVLQEKTFTRVGGNLPIELDTRVIIATHRNLEDEVKEGRFREDLFYRLKGIEVLLPPLRERGTDIILLANNFIETFCKENSLESKMLSEEAKTALLNYDYPGNVRELKSMIEVACVMSDFDVIERHVIQFSKQGVLTNLSNKDMTMREYQRKIVETYMNQHNDNTKKVADLLQIGQTTVYRIMQGK